MTLLEAILAYLCWPTESAHLTTSLSRHLEAPENPLEAPLSDANPEQEN